MKRLPYTSMDQVPGACTRISSSLKSIVVICMLLPWEIFVFPALFLWNLPKAYRVLRKHGASVWLSIKGSPLQSVNLIYLDLKRRI